jgi:hypothetical protein
VVRSSLHHPPAIIWTPPACKGDCGRRFGTRLQSYIRPARWDRDEVGALMDFRTLRSVSVWRSRGPWLATELRSAGPTSRLGVRWVARRLVPHGLRLLVLMAFESGARDSRLWHSPRRASVHHGWSLLASFRTCSNFVGREFSAGKRVRRRRSVSAAEHGSVGHPRSPSSAQSRRLINACRLANDEPNRPAGPVPCRAAASQSRTGPSRRP